MYMQYLVIKHDYSKKVTLVDNVFDSSHNASEYLQDEVFKYIIERVGNNFKIHDYHRFEPASRYWNTQDYGYHVVKDPIKESIYKMYIVMKKKIKGLFYDDYVIIPLIYYEIARQTVNAHKTHKNTYLLYKEATDEQVEDFHRNYQAVMDELVINLKKSDKDIIRNAQQNYVEVIKEIKNKLKKTL